MPDRETFEDFRKSFSYGSRSDLSFKFLKSMDDDAAARFFQRLLLLLGESFDTGQLVPLIEHAIDTQIEAYRPAPDASFQYPDGPFTPLTRALADSTIGLLTSSGHFTDDPQPFGVENMTQQEAEDRISEFLRTTPVLSEIHVAADEVAVRHGGYDVRSTRRDRNVSFPVDRLVEAAESGRIGGVADTLYSFPGATSQKRLLKELPGWVERIHGHTIDGMLLVPV